VHSSSQGETMPIERTLWRETLNKDWMPAWPCPGCGRASLAIVKASFHTVIDAKTSDKSQDPRYGSDCDTGRFVCLFRCARTDCLESCSVSGNYETSVAELPQASVYYSDCRPTSITPPPPMIQIPRECPEAIRAEVVAAFSLFWIDLASSLNRIRNALELVLNDLRVPNTTLNNKNKKIRISLHQRIERLATKRPRLKEICERMMAVKHLGNAGSHPGAKVKQDDLFDGFDILERVLQDMYSEHPGELARAVRQINMRKGPRKKNDD